MGEEEHCSFDDKVEHSGPLATCFNLFYRFWLSKLDLSRANMPNTFVNVVDVVERTEDGVKINSFSFNE